MKQKNKQMKNTAKITVYKSGIIRKSWKWRMVAANGEIIAHGRGFNSANLAANSVRVVADYFRMERYEIIVKN